MRWRQRWPERERRPKSRRLSEEEKNGILATLEKGIAASPVLTAFVEVSKDRDKVLVQFTAESISGASFGGTCLYLQREGQWEACTIKPSESATIAQAEAWLVKRKWRPWC